MNLAEQLIRKTVAEEKRILVVGDVMVDHWVNGYVDQCQDGCPKFVKETYTNTIGGAGNAYNCLMNWNVERILAGDHDFDNLPQKWRFVDRGGKIVFRYDNENKTAPCWANVISREKLFNVITKVNAVLISDYHKGLLSPEMMRDIIKECNSRNILCVVDAKREWKLYKGAIVKGNIDWLHKQLIPKYDVITLGEDVPLLQTKPLTLNYHLPKVKCVNHVGAGDCFSAHLTLALVHGFSLEDSAKIAYSAGRVYVQHPYNRPPFPEEIVADMMPR